MHEALADICLVKVRQRIAEADCPVTPSHSVEMLEHLVDHFASRAERAEPKRIDPG